MFARDVDYPTAVASSDDSGLTAAIDWCLGHVQDGDALTGWTPLKSSLRNRPQLDSFVTRNGNVTHITAREPMGSAGPVLMLWAGMDAIGELLRFGHGIRALCVVSGNEDDLRPWVTAAKPTVLGDSSAWETRTPDLDPVLVEALKGLTSTINHNNTIASGDEKNDVVGVLLALNSAGIRMEGSAMQGWALARGWVGENPELLARYVRDINAGKRPRCRNVVRSDYVESLRERVESVAREPI